MQRLIDLMNLPITEVTGAKDLMIYLTERNIRYIRIEADAMTQEEAQRIWGQIEPNWRGVCYKAGMAKGSAQIEWTLLLRKMNLIKKKAEGEPQDL